MDGLSRVMPVPAVFPVSARTGDGMASWFTWLEGKLAATPRPTAAAPTHSHPHPPGHAGPA
jgi:hypothetical protein